mmetsp:Transcript_1679/g.3356  ORF Transcript_1679/g.3356 Transcript_1679/m.3356 type:complete len:348 (-) Transcript_1679:84-1127(-)
MLGSTGIPNWKASRPEGMLPMSETSSPKAWVATVAPPTATSAEGILGWILGSMNMAAEVPTARAAEAGLACAAKCSPMNPSSSMGFNPEGATMPSAFGSWLVRMRVPTPVVNPAMTLTGQSLATTPSLDAPDASCRAPQPSVMSGRASRPCCSTAPTTSKEMAAAGPVTARVVPPMRPAATPETAAVTSPISAGTPEASAMARLRGTATHPTVKPAEISVKSVSLLNIFFHSGIIVPTPRMSREDDGDDSSETALRIGALARVSFSSWSTFALAFAFTPALVEADCFWEETLASISMGGNAAFFRKLEAALGILMEKDRRCVLLLLLLLLLVVLVRVRVLVVAVMSG